MEPAERAPHPAHPRRAIRSAGALAAGLLAVLSAQAATREPSTWDRRGFRALYSGESPAPDGSPPNDGPLLRAVLRVGDHLSSIPLILVGCGALTALLLGRGRRREAAFLALAVLPMGPASRALEVVVGRPSPFPRPGVDAFPSGHAMVSFAAAAATVTLAWPTRWRLPALGAGTAFVAAVGVAVVADGGHWPSDVVAGWLLAGLWVAVLRRVMLAR